MSYWFYSLNKEQSSEGKYIVDIYQGIRESKTCKKVMKLTYDIYDGNYYTFTVTAKEPTENKNEDYYRDFGFDITNYNQGRNNLLKAAMNPQQ